MSKQMASTRFDTGRFAARFLTFEIAFVPFKVTRFEIFQREATFRIPLIGGKFDLDGGTRR
jgi:hypothetical protein